MSIGELQHDDGDPANADVIAAGENMPISCRDNDFTEFIDRIVMNKRASAWFNPASFQHVSYRQADRHQWEMISDHCPVVAEFGIPWGS